MDVTCERCRTEYVFDENLVSQRGTTVKCTQCGHLFKVHRPGAAVAWDVRRQDGTLETLATLEDVQQRIEQGLLSEDDEISRSGEAWRALGDVSELSPFFATARSRRKRELPSVDAMSAARPKSSPPAAPLAAATHSHAPSSAGATSPATPKRSLPPGPTASTRKATLTGLGSQPIPLVAFPKQPSVEPPRASPPTHRSSAPNPEEAPTDRYRPALRIPKLDPLPATKSPATSIRPGLRLDDESEAPRIPMRRGPGLAVVVLFALGAVAIGIALNYKTLASWARGTAATAEAIAPGLAYLKLDTSDGYRLAAEVFDAAHRRSPSAVRPLVALSRTHAYWAQLMAFDASEEASQAASHPDRAERAARFATLATDHAQESFRYAQRAVAVAAGDAAAHVALADAHRLLHDFGAARAELAKANELAPATDAEPFYVAALLAADQSGNIAAARADAERAVAMDARSIRARLLLARAKLANGDAAGAASDVNAVLAQAPDHPTAMALLARLGTSETLAAADAGTSGLDAGTTEARPTNDVAAPTEAAPAAVVAPAEGAPTNEASPTSHEDTTRGARAPRETTAVPSGDYSSLLRRAEDLADRGDLAQARTTFEAALAKRPGSPEAECGLGEVLMRMGFLSGALPHLSNACGAGYAQACFSLGDAYRTSGRDADALRAYRRYLDRYPTGPRASLATRYVDELGSAGSP